MAWELERLVVITRQARTSSLEHRSGRRSLRRRVRDRGVFGGSVAEPSLGAEDRPLGQREWSRDRGSMESKVRVPDEGMGDEDLRARSALERNPEYFEPLAGGVLLDRCFLRGDHPLCPDAHQGNRAESHGELMSEQRTQNSGAVFSFRCWLISPASWP